MKWEGRRRSRNVEDRRGRRSGSSGRNSGRRMRIPMPRGRTARGGGGGLLILLVVLGVAWLLGINPLSLIGGDLGGNSGHTASARAIICPWRMRVKTNCLILLLSIWRKLKTFGHWCLNKTT